jgi:hypothetical protein
MTELPPILEAELLHSRQSNHPVGENSVKAIFFDAGDILYHRPERISILEHSLLGKRPTLHPILIQKVKVERPGILRTDQTS